MQQCELRMHAGRQAAGASEGARAAHERRLSRGASMAASSSAAAGADGAAAPQRQPSLAAPLIGSFAEQP
jgi:hypothetical protein